MKGLLQRFDPNQILVIMKKFILPIFIVSTGLLTSCFHDHFPPFGGGGDGSNGPSPVAYYKFENDALDETGNNNGVVNGATFVEDSDGNENAAIAFDGLSDFVQIPRSNDVNFDTEDFTIAFLLNTTTSNEGVIFSTRNTSNCSQASGPTFTLTIKTSGSFSATLRGSNDIKYGITSTEVANTGQWTKLTLSRNGGIIRLYVGEEETQIAIEENTDFTTLGDLFLGRTIYCTGNHLEGAIDELRIFEEYLTIEEVMELYN